MSEVLAVIPARGGSKGIPRKNLALLFDHPILAYAAAAAQQAELVTRVVCTTDDKEIAAMAVQYGVEVPFLRSPELAQDQTLDLPVFQDTLQWLAENENYRPDIVVQLRPTSPIRFPGQVDHAVRMLLINPEASAVRTVCLAPNNPFKMWRIVAEPEGKNPVMEPFATVTGIAEPYNHPHQGLPQVWWQTGTIDGTRPDIIVNGSMTGPKIVPLRMEARYAIDIDTPLSLQVAELVMQDLNCIRP